MTHRNSHEYLFNQLLVGLDSSSPVPDRRNKPLSATHERNSLISNVVELETRGRFRSDTPPPGLDTCGIENHFILSGTFSALAVETFRFVCPCGRKTGNLAEGSKMDRNCSEEMFPNPRVGTKGKYFPRNHLDRRRANTICICCSIQFVSH